MNQRMTGKLAIVTGGGLGIGGSISRRLARSGAYVVVNDIDAVAADRARAYIEAQGGRCVTVVGDIRASDTVTELRNVALATGGGRIDVLVNNVGDYRPARPTFLESSEEQWQDLYEINLLHVMRVSHAILPTMVKQGSGAVVNVATVEALRGIPRHAPYSAYNAGVCAFTKSLAVEMGPFGVRVNAIAPDLTDTPQTPAGRWIAGKDPEVVRSWLPVGRFGTPEDAAAVVEFLASADAGFVTGHTIPVDGGTIAASGWYRRGENSWTNMPERV